MQTRLAHPLIERAILNNKDLALAWYGNFMMALVQMATLLQMSLFLQAVTAWAHWTPVCRSRHWRRV